MKRKSSDLTVEFKRAAVALMTPGVKISALARELGVCRQRLYEWREALRLGDDQLRRPGRPKRTVEPPSQANDLAVRRALEGAGVEFIDENGGGPGVRLRKRQGKKA